jgi:hypothetical protein
MLNHDLIIPEAVVPLTHGASEQSARGAFHRREATENATVYVQMSVRVFAGPLQWPWNSAERKLPRLFHNSSAALSSAMSATNRSNAAITRDSAVNEK